MNCYLCNNTNFETRKGAVRDNPSLQIIECVNCGLVSLSSDQHIVVDHYEDSGMHGKMPPSIESWLKETDQDDQRRFEMLKPSLVNRKILDFGCGAAGFVHKAQAVAAEIVGVEPEQRVREYWADKLSLHASLDDAGEGFDLISAFHVVEHLPDPRATLSDLAMHLKESGSLVVEVPSSQDVLLTLYENDAFQHFTYWSQHLFLFNTETLRQLAVQAGLRIVSIRQYQRYPLSNHLYWLSYGKPGGHQNWSFLDSPGLNEAYAASLAAVGKCDTLIAHMELRPA